MSTETTCNRCGGPLPGGYAPDRPCPRCLIGAALDDSMDAGAGPADPTEGRGRPAPPSPAELAPHFPSLEILEVLGEGGMGVVYLARQRDLDRFVALKILRTELSGDDPFQERFLREARAMARLTHENIISVFDFGQAGEHPYLIMELVNGTSLRDVIAAKELSSAQALGVVGQICSALQYAHDQGVVHRDIKPENVLLDREGTVKVVDFGLAKLGQAEAAPAPTRLTGAHQAMGTPMYMAPEQIERPLEVDHRADLYSLGVVFYELLTGELPIGRFSPPSKKVEVDVRLDDVVLKTLAKEPERRYQHASAIQEDVEGIARTHGSERVMSEHVQKKSSSPWIVIAVILVCLILLPLACVAGCVAFLAPTSMEQGTWNPMVQEPEAGAPAPARPESNK